MLDTPEILQPARKCDHHVGGPRAACCWEIQIVLPHNIRYCKAADLQLGSNDAERSL